MKDKKETLITHFFPKTTITETMYSRKPGYRITTNNITTTTVKLLVVLMVMGMVMMGVGGAAATSSSRGGESELRRLWERVTSHTETLRHINWYLEQTDVFWGWFQKNSRRLDEILSPESSSSSPDNDDRVLQRLEDLERKQKAQDEEVLKMRSALQEEREKTTRLETRLNQQENNEDILRREMEAVKSCLLNGGREGDGGGEACGVGVGGEERNNQTHNLVTFVRNTMKVVTDYYNDVRNVKIPELEERMAQLEAQLAAVNQTTNINKREIDGRVTADLHELQQQTENLMDVVDEELIDVKNQIRSLSAKRPPKQGSNGALQGQIDNLHTTVANIDGKIANLDGRISGLQYTNSQQNQLQEALKDHSKIEASIERLQVRLSKLEKASGNMNLELKQMTTHVTELQQDVADLNQYNNTDQGRSMQPIGPPGRGFQGGFGRPGNQGWRGEPGDPGSRGPPGSPGSRGERGSTGAPGGRAAPGSPGPTGEQGSPGSRGAPGGRGTRGSPGLRGAPGERGATGSAGTPGNHGAPGSLGSRGAPGGRGTLGSPGSRGAPGGRGVQGNSASSGVRGVPGIPGNAGLQGPSGSPGMVGAPGSPGAPGNSGQRGAVGELGYPGLREYASYRTSPAYSEYSATPGYGRYPSTSIYGEYYQG